MPVNLRVAKNTEENGQFSLFRPTKIALEISKITVMVINNKTVMHVICNEVNVESEFKQKHIQLQLILKNWLIQNNFFW